MDTSKLAADSRKGLFSALDLDVIESTCCAWALAYAAAGLPVFPVKANKEPIWDPGLGLEHGFKDATLDPELIRRRWEKYPFADIGCAIPPSIVVLDLDRGDGEDGFRDFLTRAGQATDKIETPQASSVSGGVHLYLDANGRRFRNKIHFDGTAMDVRTDCITLPSPRSGREWLKPLSLPMLPAPDWIPEDTVKERPPGERREVAGETPYAVAARESACSNIANAPNKEQGDTLRRECYSIGGLCRRRRTRQGDDHRGADRGGT